MNKRSPISRFQFRQGFTLIELLTVIAIIAILAAILIPAVSKVRAQSYKAKSLSNLRLLQVANSLYATENDGRFVAPSVRTKKPNGRLATQQWFATPEYLDLLRGASPDGASRAVERDFPLEMFDPLALNSDSAVRVHVRSYGAFGNDPSNSQWGQEHNSGNHSARMVAPSKTAAFATAGDWRIVYGGRFNWAGIETKVNGSMAYRHLDAALVVYFDGHVGEVTKDDMRKIDEDGGIQNRFWNAQD